MDDISHSQSLDYSEIKSKETIRLLKIKINFISTTPLKTANSIRKSPLGGRHSLVRIPGNSFALGWPGSVQRSMAAHYVRTIGGASPTDGTLDHS